MQIFPKYIRHICDILQPCDVSLWIHQPHLSIFTQMTQQGHNTGVSGNSRSRPFPGIPGLPFPFPKIWNDFFIPVPLPKSWESYFSFPFPKFGNAILYSRSHYREWIVRVGNKNGNGVQKVGKRGISTDKIHLLNPLTFLDLHIIQFAISI